MLHATTCARRRPDQTCVRIISCFSSFALHMEICSPSAEGDKESDDTQAFQLDFKLAFLQSGFQDHGAFKANSECC